MSESEYVPSEQFGPDHWSTLAYVESVAVDKGFFPVGPDPRMRSNRRNFRVMHEAKPHKGFCPCAVMDRVRHATRLRDGSTVENHDDWCCLQDLAQAGYFDETDIEPGLSIRLSAVGQATVAAIRVHKQRGGSFATFTGVQGEGQ